MLKINYLEQNLSELRKHNVYIKNLLKQKENFSSEIDFIMTKSGVLTLRYGDIFLYSKYNPLKESAKFIASQNVKKNRDVVVYGLGLGYHIEELLKCLSNDVKVFVVEANIDIVYAAFVLCDLSKILADSRVNLIIGEDESDIALRFSAVLNKELNDDFSNVDNLILHQASLQCMPKAFKDLRNIFEMLQLERRTPEVFADVNYDNLLNNLDFVLESPGIECYKNRFKNYPAFFINAGPSLDNNLNIIGKYKEKAVLLCCDTAFPVLLDNNIIPDFVISVDPQDDSKYHFKNYNDAESFLVFIPTSAKAVLNMYNGPKIVALHKGHSLTSKFEELLAFKGFLYSGSSVSCMGLEVLRILGCDKIFFFGMDYAFSCGKYYSSFIAKTREWFLRSYSFWRTEMIHRESINKEKILLLNNKHNNNIMISQSLYTYLRHLENYIDECVDVEFFNVFSNGAKIRGVEDIWLEEEIASSLSCVLNKNIEYKKSELYIETKNAILERI